MNANLYELTRITMRDVIARPEAEAIQMFPNKSGLLRGSFLAARNDGTVKHLNNSTVQQLNNSTIKTIQP
jgi:hypothetical protein